MAVAGDTIQLNGGDTFTENVSFTVGVTVQSYGTGQATVAGGTGFAITFTNCGGITINNLTITNSSTAYTSGTPTVCQIVFNSSGTTVYTGFTVTNCNISGGQEAIRMSHSTVDNGGITGITIQGNTITNNSLAGIAIASSEYPSNT